MGTRRDFSKQRARDRALRSARDSQADEQALHRMGARGPYLVKPKAELDRPLHCALSPTCIVQMRARRFSKLKIGDAKRQLFTNRGNWHR